MRVFVVEDDDGIREMLIYALTSSGIEAEGFTHGEPFFSRFREAVPSLVLLDIMLPGEDGVSILKRIRQSGRAPSLPVIMLTAKGSELDRIRGLDFGADDYITKPFSVLEVVSRVKAVYRRCKEDGASSPECRVGDITLSAEKRTVTVPGGQVSLTFKEFELLRYLMTNAGIVLTRDKLLEQVWGFDYNGESRTVDMHIKSLRGKLGEAGGAIKTIRNVGYKIESDR